MGSALAKPLARQRKAVEDYIEQEEGILSDVVRLLEARILFDQWPAQLQRALRAALTEQENRWEAQKARVLRRHLFRSDKTALPSLDPAALPELEQRIAERLRADLPGQVRLGAGRGIVKEQ